MAALVTHRRDDLKRLALGASEVPAIMGLSPYATGSDVWLDRMGLAGPKDDTPAMAAGRALERPLLRMANDRDGLGFRHNRMTLAHPDYPTVPMFATPDGFGPGRQSTAEVKLVGRRFSDWSPTEPPDYVTAQARAAMACVPQARYAVVIAFVGSDLRTYRIERDLDIEERLVEFVARWWHDHIVGEVAPEPDTPAAAWRLYRARAVLDAREERLAGPDEQAVGSELRVIAETVKSLDARADELRRALALTSAEADVLGVGWRAGWRARADTAWKAVAMAAGATPDAIEANTRRSSSFVFRLDGEGAT